MLQRLEGVDDGLAGAGIELGRDEVLEGQVVPAVDQQLVLYVLRRVEVLTLGVLSGTSSLQKRA